MIKIRRLNLSKFFIFSFFALVFGVLVFEACNKEIVTTSQSDANDALNKQKIMDAKTWFEKNRNNVLTGAIEDFKNIAPVWETAINCKNSVELDVSINGRFTAPKNSKKENNLGKSKILFTPNSNGYLIEFLSYSPSDSFVGNIKKINATNILDENFDGSFAYQDIKSKFIYLYEISQGEIIKLHKASKNSDDFSNPNVSFRDALCSYPSCTVWYNQNWDALNGYGPVYDIQTVCITLFYPCQGISTQGSGPGYGTDWWNTDPSGQPKKVGGNTTKPQCGNGTKTSQLTRNVPLLYLGNIQVGEITFKVDYTVFDCSGPNYSARAYKSITDNHNSLSIIESNVYPQGYGDAGNSQQGGYYKNSLDHNEGYNVSTHVTADVQVTGSVPYGIQVNFTVSVDGITNLVLLD